MKLSELDYEFPEELIGTEPSRPCRVLWVDDQAPPEEVSLQTVLDRIPVGDVLVINDTQVLKRRLFTNEQVEVLFLDEIRKSQKSNTWQVLFPSKKYNVGSVLTLPNGSQMKLVEKGRPQIVEVSPPLTDADFEEHGELPLPPYIQKAREQRHNFTEDDSWYQTQWAEKPGSMAAPTASLHFTENQIEELRKKGVKVIKVTLHVGLGTFLPVTVDDLDHHVMHSEYYEISEEKWLEILHAKKMKHKIWSLGTTTTRVLESVARTGKLSGETDILLQVGSEFKIVDRLMTNFHQPQSTLLALVAGFAGLEKVQSSYRWAIERKFKLFSYGDFSVWLK